MRTARLIGLGFGRAWKIKAPVLLIALVNLALALVITAPVYKWFRDHLNESSDALNLLHGPTARFLFELSQYDRTNVYSLIRTSFLWTAILGFFLAVFLAAGLFAALARPDTRPRFSHFFFFAANLFPRFLAMTVLVGAAAIVFVIALNIPMTAISYRLTQRSVSDMSPIWLALVQFAISGLFILYFFLILDYARIDTRGVSRSAPSSKPGGGIPPREPPVLEDLPPGARVPSPSADPVRGLCSVALVQLDRGHGSVSADAAAPAGGCFRPVRSASGDDRLRSRASRRLGARPCCPA